MRIAYKPGDIGELRIGDVPDPAPAHGLFIVRRRDRRQRRVPCCVECRVGELRQGRVEEVVAWGEGLDLLKG